MQPDFRYLTICDVPRGAIGLALYKRLTTKGYLGYTESQARQGAVALVSYLVGLPAITHKILENLPFLLRNLKIH